MSDSTGKDTIYIDIDDEITGIIDKVRGSDERILALVLPKRATALQSIVNMKLLKRGADDAKKRLVLITSEAGLMPLAGAAGIHIAHNLQSKPFKTPAPGGDATENIAESSVSAFDEDETPEHVDLSNAGNKPVGELSGAAALAATPDDTETIELDNEDELPAAGAATGAAAAAVKKPKPKRDKKLMVPNFNRFRVLMALGAAGLVALIFLLYLALAVLPKAAIAISTDSSTVNASASLTLDPATKELDLDTTTVPAERQQKQQTSSQQVAATGQKNNGNKAQGAVTLSLNNCEVDQVTIPAGTGVSTNGLTFITQSDVTLSSVKVAGKCNPNSFKDIYSQSASVTAQSPGANYNIGPSSFSVSGQSSSNVSAKSGDAMSGGTDNIIKVVSQGDIDNAKQKLSSSDSAAAKQALQQQLEQNGFYVIDATFSGSTPSISSSASVGDQADNVTVTQVVTYTMYGAKEADLKKIITDKVKDHIDPSKQTILDDGLSKASFNVTGTSPEQVAMQATATAGPDIKIDQLKQQIAGKKSGEIKTLIKNNPGVVDVNVKFSPFWVNSAPKKPSKITVTFVKAPASSNAKSANP
jgi:hypothetical protein